MYRKLTAYSIVFIQLRTSIVFRDSRHIVGTCFEKSEFSVRGFVVCKYEKGVKICWSYLSLTLKLFVNETKLNIKKAFNILPKTH